MPVTLRQAQLLPSTDSISTSSALSAFLLHLFEPSLSPKEGQFGFWHSEAKGKAHQRSADHGILIKNPLLLLKLPNLPLKLVGGEPVEELGVDPTIVITVEHFFSYSGVGRTIWRTSAVQEGGIVRLLLGVEKSLAEVVEVVAGL